MKESPKKATSTHGFNDLRRSFLMSTQEDKGYEVDDFQDVRLELNATGHNLVSADRFPLLS